MKSLASPPDSAESPNWNPPEMKPAVPGEYRAALIPEDAVGTVRRWWTGYVWSNPYHSDYSEELKEKIRRQPSGFKPYWQPLSD